LRKRTARRILPECERKAVSSSGLYLRGCTIYSRQASREPNDARLLASRKAPSSRKQDEETRVKNSALTCSPDPAVSPA
jgi:hypothetical protein